MDYVIGCDIGTQSVKAVMLSVEGKLVAESSVEYGINYPQATWAEQDPLTWVNALCRSVRTLIEKIEGIRGHIIAIGLDSQVDGLVAVGSHGSAMYPAIIWMDRRAISQCIDIGERLDQNIIRGITGLNLDPSHVAPKIRWLYDNEEKIFNETKYFLTPGSYAAYILTGEIGVDYSNASSTMLLDINTKIWSDYLCDKLNIDECKLGIVYPATQILGELKKKYADEMGLPDSIPIIVGCGDEHAACIGAGAVYPGIVCDIAGTGEPVCVSLTKPILDDSGLLETHCHADPDLWLLENPGFVSGGAYRWFKEQFGYKEIEAASSNNNDVFTLLNNEAMKVLPGSDGLIMLPFLMGATAPTWNPNARGTYIGFTLAHKKAHFIRALLESSAYFLRDNTDRMMNMGLAVDEIRVVGGGAKSPLWMQIKADVTGLPVTQLETVQTAALGSGILALVGSKKMLSVEQAVTNVVKVRYTYQPNEGNKSIYDDCYNLYRSAYFTLVPFFEEAKGKSNA